jgi:O-antigen/teichoic acid export membrane protein
MGTSAVLRIAYVVYAGRVLQPEEYAEFYTALALIFLASTALSPVSGSITRYVSLFAAGGEMNRVRALRSVMSRRVVKWAIWVLVGGAVVSYPIAMVLRFQSIFTPLLAGVALALSLPVEFSRGILRGVARFRAYSASLILEALLRLLLCIVLLYFFSMAGMGLLAYVVALGLMLLILPRQLGSIGQGTSLPEHEEDRQSVERLMGPLLLFAVAGAAFQNMDVLLVKRMFSPLEAGYYSAAASLAKSAALVFAPFGVLLLPLLTAAYAREEALLPIFLRTVGRFTAFSGVLVAIFAIEGDAIVGQLYGGAYAAAGPLLPVLTSAMVLALISIMIGQAFAAVNRFAFLTTYIAGVGVLAAGLGLSNSIRTAAWVVFAVQGLTLLALAAHFLASLKREPAFKGRGVSV